MTRHSRNIVVTEAFTYKKKISSDYTRNGLLKTVLRF